MIDLMVSLQPYFFTTERTEKPLRPGVSAGEKTVSRAETRRLEELQGGASRGD